jgi:hypothetical protein
MGELLPVLGLFALIFAAGVYVGEVMACRAHRNAIRAHNALLAEAEELRRTRLYVGTGPDIERSATWHIGKAGLFRLTLSDKVDA